MTFHLNPVKCNVQEKARTKYPLPSPPRTKKKENRKETMKLDTNDRGFHITRNREGLVLPEKTEVGSACSTTHSFISTSLMKL